ncbi:hypothetical protein NUW54_g6809 [Trametes sanguinea]|uniref:Uncharacterized protein n=1 Tax=Trametes sanguinea TaxID=158606 RepID=A0ACC1PTR9_9APHY|nr:hypothetical protein NUW54_g6809 [Trametes sanguinea]
MGSRRLREILLRQAHSVLAHLGTKKTLAYLRDEVWWPNMVSDVVAYCKTCGVCATTKSATTQPMGLLKPLPVPRRPWQYISLDFVGPLPASENRHGQFDMICVIIDQLTSMVHLVPTVQTYGAADMAEVVFEHVYKLHGLPERIISDRDTLFTSTFWQKLHGLLGTELRLSSSYHPQTDGLTERANRTMTQMLRQCVRPDQKDWVVRLPAVELAMNMARSETTGFSPFYLNYGQMPRSLVWSSECEYPGVQAFAQRVKEAIMAAHDAIIASRTSQVEQANKRRRPATFQVDELVYLSTKNLNLPKGRARKLAPKYLGPFRITEEVTKGATYRIDLPRELRARGIHNAFHASLLRQHVPNDDRRFPGRQFHQLPGFGEQPREWAVDRIISHVGRGSEAEFEVQWSTGDVTWAPYSDPNVARSWDEVGQRMTFRALRDIAEGEELCMNYVDVLGTRAQRMEELRTAFGFECACEACALESEELAASDRRRAAVRRLFEEVAFCILVSDYAHAKLWVRKAWEASCSTSGPDSPASRAFKMYWANPRAHELAGALQPATLHGPD